MNDTLKAHEALCGKIARLVEERGWSQDEFARRSRLHRLTVVKIFQEGGHKLHNATVARCARALGLGVRDLRQKPLDELLPRMRVVVPTRGESEPSRQAYEEASQPELIAWAADHPDQARSLTPAEWDELLSLQGTGGPLSARGVEYFVQRIERKRRLAEKIAAIAGTEHLGLLEEFVDLLYARVQPYRGRGTKADADDREPR